MIPAPQKNKCWKGLTPSSTAYEVARFFIQQQKPLLIVLPTSQSAEVFIEDLKFFLGNKTPLHFFPNLDVLPYFQLSPHPEILTTRLSTLYEMSTARKPFIVISSYTALARRLPPKSIFNTYADYVVSKEEID
ncbi:MAG: hypothetical protein JNK65_02370, partial [Deltaproteobacteria bacterium]|nr:hypothetical protein [Deltaproteobacteria bacterium]